jgi:hypothetical protein
VLGHTASHCKKSGAQEVERVRKITASTFAERRAQEQKPPNGYAVPPLYKAGGGRHGRTESRGQFAALDDSEDETDAADRISKKQAKKEAKAQAAKEAAEAAVKAIQDSEKAKRYLSALLGIGKKTAAAGSAPTTVSATMTLTKHSLSLVNASKTAPKPLRNYKCWADAEEDEEDNISDLSN